MATFYRPTHAFQRTEMQKRLTWTTFHLSSAKPWPTWPDAAVPGGTQYSDLYLGLLCNVPGVKNVRLGRRVEDVEQAAFIIREFITYGSYVVYRPLLSILVSPHASDK
jgi:hypothetical protein